MKTVTFPDNFAQIADSYSSYNSSKAVILPLPYEKTTCYIKGTEKGPSAIIEASKELELYDEEQGNVFEIGICTLKPLEAKGATELIGGIINKEIKELLDDGKFVVTIGGEHSITPAIVQAYHDKFDDLSVLQIDAHSDLREEFEGTKFSHACAMKRTMEFSPIVPVAIRSLSYEEAKLIEERKIRVFWAKDIIDNDKWFDQAISGLSRNVYITLDLDALDPSIMPSVGTPEPGGMGYYQALRFLKSVFKKRNVVGFDVVELCPNENDISSDFTAARIIYKMIGYKQHEKS